MTTKSQLNYQTKGGVDIIRTTEQTDNNKAFKHLISSLDSYRGAVFSSNFEYPGRYTRWDIGFKNPPIVITAKEQSFSIEALNERGQIILLPIIHAIKTLDAIKTIDIQNNIVTGSIIKSTERFPEELRSKQPSVFSLLRAIINLFYSHKDQYLGLYGSFGYDLVFQFESLQKHLKRPSDQRDLVLYLPDEILVRDNAQRITQIYYYDFHFQGKNTSGLKREGIQKSYEAKHQPDKQSDHAPGEYAELVRTAHEAFKKGDLFEVVPSQTFYEFSKNSPATIFHFLLKSNPSPYSFLINLGDDEYLVGASPEMFVRVTNERIETCPISGTIARGQDPLDDAEQILKLLNSDKETAELTMCTDVDRNDKSRVCIPESVKVIGRRQIEIYSRLIHTVDHVEGMLQEDYDALDAFLSHAWVVTVTGAPKLWAMQFIEDHEKSPRRWFAGAVGWLGFDRNINTGLTIRSIRIKEGIAELRVGATLLYDSIPEAEEEETKLKASAFLHAIKHAHIPTKKHRDTNKLQQPGKGKQIILIDHQDSFVHTLANYFRKTGATIITLRNSLNDDDLKQYRPDMIVLSPGPGRPDDFPIKNTIDLALKNNVPLFGVCLGLQAIVEYFGGELGILDYPMHGKSSQVTVKSNSSLFKNLPDEITIGRYHSLYAIKDKFPEALTVTAVSSDQVIMAIEHKTLPIAGVQFHPESILSLKEQIGQIIINNCLDLIK